MRGVPDIFSLVPAVLYIHGRSSCYIFLGSCSTIQTWEEFLLYFPWFLQYYTDMRRVPDIFSWSLHYTLYNSHERSSWYIFLGPCSTIQTWKEFLVYFFWSLQYTVMRGVPDIFSLVPAVTVMIGVPGIFSLVPAVYSHEWSSWYKYFF